METMIVRFAVLLGVFASVFLISQVILGAIWRKGQAHSAINRRLSMIKAGGDRDEIIARLRKNATDELGNLPGFIAAPLRSLQRANIPVLSLSLDNFNHEGADRSAIERAVTAFIEGPAGERARTRQATNAR